MLSEEKMLAWERATLKKSLPISQKYRPPPKNLPKPFGAILAPHLRLN